MQPSSCLNRHGRRHATLDGLRGIAALAVLLYHVGNLAPIAMPGGYLAVDFFFALSGFVLAKAYGDRLAGPAEIARFLGTRLLRIYPLVLVGGLTGMVLVGGSATALLLLPDPSGEGLLYRANPALWSVAFELLVNFAWAMVAVWLTTTRLFVILALSGGALIFAVLDHGSADLGPFFYSVPQGLVRTVFSFTFGLLLFRFYRHTGSRSYTSGWAWLIMPALATVLMLAPNSRTMLDLAAIMLIMPALLWLGIHFEPYRPGLCLWLGALSYPLYCIHNTVVIYFRDYPHHMVIACCATIVAASALDRWFDRPVRRKIMRWMVGTKPAVSAT